MSLFELDSPCDLVCRGFSRDEVLSLTGDDPGYHANGLRGQLKGVDRVAYKAEHVRSRIGESRVRELLDTYATGGLSGEELLVELGLRNPSISRLRAIFALTSWADAFVLADKARRTVTMRRGFAKVHDGVDNPFRLSDVQERAARTREARYGGRYTLSGGSSLADGARETFCEHMTDEEFRRSVREAKAQTNMERRGVTAPAMDEDVLSKMRQTCLDRYGETSWTKTDEARHAQSAFSRRMWSERHDEVNESRVITCIARYGVDHPSQTKAARKRQSEVMRREVVKRARVARVESGYELFGSSVVEEILYGLLVDRFGSDDVFRHHVDVVRYPFQCDFYVQSRDLFIELNGHWTHGGHWYGEADETLLQKWSESDSEYYRMAAKTWSLGDVCKREAARASNLNYVVFWDGSNQLLDAHLWLDMGCPDGCDWAREYSWLPDRSISCDVPWPERLVETSGIVRKVAAAANGDLLYARELDLWRKNDHMRRWGTTQAWLYANRHRHGGNGGPWTGPLPDEVSDMELLRGFGISGLVRSYSRFDNTAMVSICRSHRVASVYDPCAGWGERLATCGALGIRYVGCDVRPELADGYRRIVDRYGLADCHFVTADAAAYDAMAFDHDCVFTCPPYGSVEWYSETGAENLGLDDFATWWSEVVRHSVSSSTRIFAVQTNQAFREVFSRPIVDAGFAFVEEIALRRSSRPYNVGKREYECVLVFER